MLLITSLEDIAWLLNLRGNDIEFTPVFYSFLIFHREGRKYSVDLFITKEKVSDPAIQDYL